MTFTITVLRDDKAGQADTRLDQNAASECRSLSGGIQPRSNWRPENKFQVQWSQAEATSENAEHTSFWQGLVSC